MPKPKSILLKQEPNISPQEFEKIERYLTHSMDVEEQSAFESEIASNSSLQQKVNEVRILIAGVEAAALKDKLETFHSKVQPTHSAVKTPNTFIKKKKKNYAWYGVAASIFLFMGLFWFLNKSPKNEELYNKYYIQDAGLPTTMSSTSQYTFYEGMVRYKQGHFQEALQTWKALHKENPKNDTLQYFIGVAHTALENDSEALKFLNEVSHNQQSSFHEDANYYLGLLYLKNNEWQKSLDKLKQNTSKQSQRLQEEIKKFYEKP